MIDTAQNRFGRGGFVLVFLLKMCYNKKVFRKVFNLFYAE